MNMGFEIFQGLAALGGGLALFLYGLEQCRALFSALLGDGAGLRRLTRRGPGAFAFGLVLAAATQSTTVAAGFAVGLVDLGALTLSSSLLVMMGSSVGTAFLVFLIAFDTALLAPLGLCVGACLRRVKRLRPLGGVVMGVSLVLLGMALIKSGITPLQEAGVFELLLRHAGGHWFALFFVGLVTTALTSSSVPVLGLAVALGGSGALSVVDAFPIILGSRVGNCFMVMVAGLSGRTNAKALAWATLLFRLAAVIVLAPLTRPLMALFERFSQDAGLLISLAQFFVAWFNVALMLPLCAPLERVSLALAGESDEDPALPRYINEEVTGGKLAQVLLAREMIRLASLLDERLYLATSEGGDAAARRGERLSADLPLLAESCSQALARLRANSPDLEGVTPLAYSMNALREMTRVVCVKFPAACDALEGSFEGASGLCQLSVALVRKSLVALALGEDRAFYRTLELKEDYRHAVEEAREELAFGRAQNPKAIKALFVLDRLARCATELARGELVGRTLKEEEHVALEEEKEI